LDDPSIIIVGAVLVAGYIAFQFFLSNRSNSKHPPKKQQSPPSKSTLSSNKLYQARKDDTKPILSNEVTVIAKSRFARDEILGSIDMIEGLHPTPSDYTKSDVIRAWTYIGYPNTSFDSQFKKEVQSIITDMKKNGWSAESAPSIGKKEIWLLTR